MVRDKFINTVPGDVVATMEELGVDPVKVVGDEASAHCPAHFERVGKEDRNVSFSINTESGYFNCFSCGFAGPFVFLVKYITELDEDEANAWIRQRGGIDHVRKKLGRGSSGVSNEIEEITEADLALFYPPTQRTLDTRKIDSWAADAYEVLWDREREMWITTVRDPRTHALRGWQEKNKRFFNNRPRGLQKADTLYGWNLVKPDSVVVIQESPLDSPRVASAFGGFEECVPVSSYGAELSDAQLELIGTRARMLVSALDNDQAGDKTNRHLRKRLRYFAYGVELKFWNYEDSMHAKDPGEQTDNEIFRAFDTATSSAITRW